MFKKSNQGSRFERGGSGNRSGDRGRGAERPEMHRATCADCAQSCEVPFKPNGSRPVFCRDCFKANQGEGQGEVRSSGGFGGRSPERGRSSERERDFEEKQFFDAECATCGDECTVPFKPKAGRPIFCRDCMGKKDKPREERSFSRDEGKSFREDRQDRGFSLSKEQYEVLAAKMDQILKIVQGSQTYTVKAPKIADVAKPKKAQAKVKNVKKAKLKKA